MICKSSLTCPNIWSRCLLGLQEFCLFFENQSPTNLRHRFTTLLPPCASPVAARIRLALLRPPSLYAASTAHFTRNMQFFTEPQIFAGRVVTFLILSFRERINELRKFKFYSFPSETTISSFDSHFLSRIDNTTRVSPSNRIILPALLKFKPPVPSSLSLVYHDASGVELAMKISTSLLCRPPQTRIATFEAFIDRRG